MGTCKTCRFWGPNQPGFDVNEYSNKQGVCVCPKVHFATTRIDDDCSEHLVDAKSDHALESDEVGVKDGSGYFAAMFTGPDFGCCHWELSPNVLVTQDRNGQIVVKNVVGTHDGRTIQNNAGDIGLTPQPPSDNNSSG